VLDVTDDDRLEPVLGPTVARDAENGREPTLFFVTPEEGHSGAGAETASPESKNTDRTKLGTGGVHGFQAWPSRPSRNDHPRGENERWWVRLRGLVGSLILHLLPLLLLVQGMVCLFLIIVTINHQYRLRPHHQKSIMSMLL